MEQNLPHTIDGDLPLIATLLLSFRAAAPEFWSAALLVHGSQQI
jgi:hypothetical protein